MGERSKHLEKLPEILLKLRTGKKVSQREVAEAIGITSSVLSNYEKGTKSPSLEIAYALADYYDVTLDELCGRSLETGDLAGLMRSFLNLHRNMPCCVPIQFEDVPWRKSKEVAWMGDEVEYEMLEDANPGSHQTLKCATWTIPYDELAQFMESYEQLLSLVLKGQVKQDVLDFWLRKQLDEAASTER